MKIKKRNLLLLLGLLLITFAVFSFIPEKNFCGISSTFQESKQNESYLNKSEQENSKVLFLDCANFF